MCMMVVEKRLGRAVNVFNPWSSLRPRYRHQIRHKKNKNENKKKHRRGNKDWGLDSKVNPEWKRRPRVIVIDPKGVIRRSPDIENHAKEVFGNDLGWNMEGIEIKAKGLQGPCFVSWICLPIFTFTMALRAMFRCVDSCVCRRGPCLVFVDLW